MSLFVLSKIRRNVKEQRLIVEQHSVSRFTQNTSNLTSSVDTLQLDVILRLLNSFTNELGRLGLTLGLDDSSLLLLTSAVDNESSTLSFLLSNLLGFDGGGKLRRESHESERNIVEINVELVGASD